MVNKLEETSKKLKRVESMCLCEDCPTYMEIGSKDDYIAYCFPTRGRSRRIKKEVGCICPTCPVYDEMAFKKDYFCTRGTEMEQRG